MGIFKERLISTFQNAINYQLKSLKELANSIEDFDNLPDYLDDIHDNALEDIHTIISIKVTDFGTLKDRITNKDVFFCDIEVVYNSVGNIYLTSILDTIEDRVGKMLGLKIIFNEDTINKHWSEGQW